MTDIITKEELELLLEDGAEISRLPSALENAIAGFKQVMLEHLAKANELSTVHEQQIAQLRLEMAQQEEARAQELRLLHGMIGNLTELISNKDEPDYEMLVGKITDAIKISTMTKPDYVLNVRRDEEGVIQGVTATKREVMTQ